MQVERRDNNDGTMGSTTFAEIQTGLQQNSTRGIQLPPLSPPLWLSSCLYTTISTMRKLKHHEQKLLKKVDFLNVSYSSC